jgi:hypothetical protein
VSAITEIKEECLDRIIPLSERHLRRTPANFVLHYHGETPANRATGTPARTIDQLIVQSLMVPW